MPYILLIEHADTSVSIAKDTDGRHLVANNGNQYLLREIGDEILEENLGVGYQLAMLCGFPTRKDLYTPD